MMDLKSGLGRTAEFIFFETLKENEPKVDVQEALILRGHGWPGAVQPPQLAQACCDDLFSVRKSAEGISISLCGLAASLQPLIYKIN
ncbi:MAG: hypothetical protein OEY00_04240 [Gammaproteobacteria bacterium]|nr:hypothetical protein [Gammaproteobacteria bacterium]